MLKRFIKKLLAPIIQEVFQEDVLKKELINNQIMEIINNSLKQMTSQ